MRPVPRNIDKPNRLVEYIVSFMLSYFGMKFLVPGNALIPIGVSSLCVYIIHKITADKPEGAAFRLWYRFASFGGFFPSPRKVKKFEV
jgi:hypothetical protein